MSLQGYECNQCKSNFEEAEQNCSETSREIKCPSCGSTDITPSEAAAELLELINEMGRTGG